MGLALEKKLKKTSHTKLEEIFDRFRQEYKLPLNIEDGKSVLQGPWYSITFEQEKEYNYLLYSEKVVFAGFYEGEGGNSMCYAVKPPYLKAQLSVLKNLKLKLSEDIHNLLTKKLTKKKPFPEAHTVVTLDLNSLNEVYSFLGKHIEL